MCAHVEVRGQYQVFSSIALILFFDTGFFFFFFFWQSLNLEVTILPYTGGPPIPEDLPVSSQPLVPGLEACSTPSLYVGAEDWAQVTVYVHGAFYYCDQLDPALSSSRLWEDWLFGLHIALRDSNLQAAFEGRWLCGWVYLQTIPSVWHQPCSPDR
jgi:hypothetical protein